MMELENQEKYVEPEDQVKSFLLSYADYCLVIGALADSILLLESTDLSLYEDGRLRLVASRLLLDALAPQG